LYLLTTSAIFDGGFAGAVDQKLGEVPFDRGGPEGAALLVFQELVQRMGIFARCKAAQEIHE